MNDLTAFKPDPKPEKRPRKDIRVKDKTASRRSLSRYDACAACGHRAQNSHHVVEKGSPHHGDDVAENLVSLCGSGTTRCHGAYHGSPYVVKGERRDAAWVSVRIGKHLLDHRPDTIEYVTEKLGEQPASAYLERFYCIRLDDDQVWRQAPCAAPDAPAGAPGALQVFV